MQSLQVNISNDDFNRLGLSGNAQKIDSLQKRIEQIGQLLIWLDDAEQEALYQALRKQILLAQAARLSRSVRPNQVNMQTVVEEVRQVRAANHEAK